jgi:formylglycine-generating enzyme required for sulfatase activity
MGAPTTEEGFAPGEEQHEVEIPKPFHMSVCTVTQEQYEKVIGSNPSHFAASGAGKDIVAGMKTSTFPVENVTGEDAVEFCKKLSDRPEEKSKGRRYRLPTEAEWEYAARAGTTTATYFGPSLSSKQANFNGAVPYGGAPAGPALGRPAPVGTYSPNPFGLYDMLGNVWQWTGDWYDPGYYGKSPRQDPSGASVSPIGEYTMRGGSFDAAGNYCRAASRGHGIPNGRWPNSGFRVVMAAGP